VSDNERDRAIWGAVCLAFAIIWAVFIGRGLTRPDVGVLQVGSVLRLDWLPVDGAAAYEVQFRLFEGDWETVAVARDAWVFLPAPVGSSEFRIRGWDADGPRRWSAPSEPLLYLPEPEAPRLDLLQTDQG